MRFFYIADKSSASGFKEVHDQDCPEIPDMLNRKYLGPFNNPSEAIRRVKQTDPLAVGCEVCCLSVSERNTP